MRALAEEIAATSGEINNLASVTQQLTANLNEVVLGSAASEEGGVKPLAAKSSAEIKKSSVVPKIAKKGTPVLSAVKDPGASLKPSASTKNESKDAIPFDEDVRSNVGTTEGF